jgi:hypothetical protein
MNDRNSLIKEINKIYRNKGTIKVYYMIGKLLHRLNESFDSDQAFEDYLKSDQCEIAFRWDSCKCYLAFADFISEFPRFQLTSFDLTEWRNVKVRLRTWFGDPDCSMLLSTDHFSRNFWAVIEIFDVEANSEPAAISHFIADDEHIAIPDREQYETIIPY